MGQQKGNPIPSYQNQAYEALRPNTGARVNRDMGTKPVMIDDTKTLDELIDSGSQLFTQGYAKDSDLIDGTINARFDTLTANEYHITILSSSVLYANGSNKFGDSADDRHEFTGSILVGGDVLGNARLNQATASLQFHSASVNAQLLAIQQTTQSLHVATASLNAFTASQDSRNLTLSTVTGSLIGITNGLMGYTSSVIPRILQTTASLNTYTGSNDSVVARILQTTASLNAFTSSQLAVNLGISTATGSLNGISNGVMAFTSSLKAATIFSGSIQIGVNLVNYANDAAAAAGGVPVGGLYHTAGTVKVRLT